MIMIWFDTMHYHTSFRTRPRHVLVYQIIGIIQLCCIATTLFCKLSLNIILDLCHYSNMFQFSFTLSVYLTIWYLNMSKGSLYSGGDSCQSLCQKRHHMKNITHIFLLRSCSPNLYLSSHGRLKQECFVQLAHLVLPLWFGIKDCGLVLQLCAVQLKRKVLRIFDPVQYTFLYALLWWMVHAHVEKAHYMVVDCEKGQQKLLSTSTI